MCGICSSVDLKSLAEPEAARLRVGAMLQSMAHRGPNDSGYMATKSAVLGVARLAIRGLTDANQPIADAASGVIAICNGEIDNHRELRRWLSDRGRVVHGTTDVAVIPELYLELGEQFVERLVGAFAIAIWDPRKPCLILARDRAGERPLFYTTLGNEIIIASELAALVSEHRLPVGLDPLALKKYLQFGIFPAPMSPFLEIRKLEPGQIVKFDGTGTTARKYWRWQVNAAVDASPSLEHFDQIFRGAIARQTDVDVDFGIFLSGGIDSSLVSAVVRSLHPQRRLRAYTLRFSEKSFDEGNHAEIVAEKLHLDLQTLWVTPEAVQDGVKTLIQLVGEPLADPAWIPAALLARRASQDVKMALVGEGADELFGGYPTYIGAGLANRFSRMPKWIRALFRRSIEALPPSEKKVSLTFLLKRFVSGMELDGLARHQCWISNISPSIFERLTGQTVGVPPADPDRTRLLDRLQQWDLENTLAEGLLTKADRSSMSSSLELRAPFLDEAVMAFAQSLPPVHRTRRFATKVFLKQYALRYLPENIVERRKRGLSVPIGAWLRGAMQHWARTRLGNGNLKRAGIRPEIALELFEEHLSAKADHARALWSLIVLSEWLNWVESETQKSASATDLTSARDALHGTVHTK